MDYRRCFGLRAPRPIGDSTILVPQLENYSLFATPFLDLNKKISKLVGVTKDVKSPSEESSSRKRMPTRQTNKKQDEEIPSKETSQASDSFGIVLNVVTVKPKELSITFDKGNVIEVKVQQENVESEYGSIPFKRNCTYKYELPDDIDKNCLVALWTSDDYLIILPNDQLREDLLNKSLRESKKLAESSDEVISPVEATRSEDLDEKLESKPGTSKVKEVKLKKSSKSNEKIKPRKASEPAEGESVAEEVKNVFQENWSIPVHMVTRMLRPGLDIFMLRKYMVDLESYVSAARKFIENASFVTQNSKTAERCIRYLAKSYADDFYEDINLKDDNKKGKKTKEPSPDSGYSTSNPERSE